VHEALRAPAREVRTVAIRVDAEVCAQVLDEASSVT